VSQETSAQVRVIVWFKACIKSSPIPPGQH